MALSIVDKKGYGGVIWLHQEGRGNGLVAKAKQLKIMLEEGLDTVDAFEKAGGLDTTFHFLLDHQLWIKIAAQGKILHINQTWSAARYHAEAKNRAKAAEFGREAFRILGWAAQDEKLSPVLARVSRRARASVHRVDARYLLDGGQAWPALKAWMHALFIHPPTALRPINLFVSAILNLIGLERVRENILKRRRQRLNK